MGGIERALTVLAGYFLNQGYEVYFISAQGGEQFYELDKKIILFELKEFRQKGLLGKIKFYLNVVSFIKKTVNHSKPDVVLSFGDAFNPLVLLALLGTKIPVYISDRTSPDFKFNPIIKFGKKILYPNSSGFIAQTQKAADFKLKQFGDKLNIKVIPNAIKQIYLHDVKREQQIVCVARLSKEKGVERLLYAFSLIENNNNWKLVFAGNGPLLHYLQKMAVDLQIQDSVSFLGQVKDIDYLLCQSSIFVLPSYIEGFPNALCEALSAGLPSICFESIPFENIIEDGVNGFVIKNNDLKELAFKIKLLMENDLKREELSKNAELFNNKYSLEKIGKMYLEFLLKNNCKIIKK
jgi:glycosyltransferase involved in cell wall biosynthesis